MAEEGKLEEASQAWKAAERAEAGLRLLAEASDLLARHMEPEEALKDLAELVMGRLADYGITYICEDGAIRRVGLAHVDGRKRSLVESLELNGPPSLEDDVGAGRVIRTGTPIFVSEVTDAMLETASRSPAYLDILHRLKPRSCIIVPLQARGRIIGAMAFAFTEDSGRRHGEADLHLAQELAGRAALLVDNARLYRQARDAIRARDELLAIVSHDLRNPLSTVISASEVLELDPPAERRVQHLDAIRRAAVQMSRLVQDLLDISRIEAGGLPVQPRPIDVEPLLAEACAMFQSRAVEGGVELLHEAPPHLPRAHADRERVLQVLANLLDNALKHAPAGGRVLLSARAEDAFLQVAVADDGEGIPEEQQTRVFDRFWQSERARQAGAGLGLAIAKGIVEAQGGTIGLESRQGAGTTFRFTLPLDAPDAGAGEGQPQPDADARQGLLARLFH